MNSPCSTTPGTCLTARAERVEVGAARAARSRGSGGPRRSRRPRRRRAAAARRRAAARPAGGACRASRSAPPRPAAGSLAQPRRPASTPRPPPRSGARREITIFSRSSAPPPPLIRRSAGSTSSAPSSARSSSTVPSSSTSSKPAARASSSVRDDATAVRTGCAARAPAARPPSTPPAPSRARSSCRARPARPAAAAAAGRAARRSPDELGVHLDRRHRRQRPRHRAVLLGALGDALELVGLDPGHARARVQDDAGDASAGRRPARGARSPSSRRSRARSRRGPRSPDSAIEKQPACAAAISSSGLVPSPSSKRDWNEYGPLVGAARHAHRPVPSCREPFHTALAVLFGISQPPVVGVLSPARYPAAHVGDCSTVL